MHRDVRPAEGVHGIVLQELRAASWAVHTRSQALAVHRMNNPCWADPASPASSSASSGSTLAVARGIESRRGATASFGLRTGPRPCPDAAYR